jgi:hypothetical protein
MVVESGAKWSHTSLFHRRFDGTRDLATTITLMRQAAWMHYGLKF